MVIFLAVDHHSGTHVGMSLFDQRRRNMAAQVKRCCFAGKLRRAIPEVEKLQVPIRKDDFTSLYN